MSNKHIARSLPKSFTGFRSLPFELRSRVWGLAIEPRLITITAKQPLNSTVFQAAVESQPIPLLCVCRESRDKVSKAYVRVKFDDERGAVTYINWSRDTLFLDILDNRLAVDQIIKLLGPSFEAVQTLAIRLRSCIVLAFPDLLRLPTSTRRLIFVNDITEPAILQDLSIVYYPIDIGTTSVFRGCYMDTSGLSFGEDVPIRLQKCERDTLFSQGHWETSPKAIGSALSNVVESYALILLPSTLSSCTLCQETCDTQIIRE